VFGIHKKQASSECEFINDIKLKLSVLVILAIDTLEVLIEFCLIKLIGELKEEVWIRGDLVEQMEYHIAMGVFTGS
jgi:hypothetical protein